MRSGLIAGKQRGYQQAEQARSRFQAGAQAGEVVLTRPAADGFVGAAALERLETSSDDKVHSAHADNMTIFHHSNYRLAIFHALFPSPVGERWGSKKGSGYG